MAHFLLGHIFILPRLQSQSDSLKLSLMKIPNDEMLLSVLSSLRSSFDPIIFKLLSNENRYYVGGNLNEKPFPRLKLNVSLKKLEFRSNALAIDLNFLPTTHLIRQLNANYCFKKKLKAKLFNYLINNINYRIKDQ